MTDFGVELIGQTGLRNWLANAADEIREQVGYELSDIAAELEGDIALRIQQGPKTGRVYKRRSVTHRASMAGQSPANDTGTLMKSIYSERESRLTYTVGSRVVYALYLEYGTRKMAARPFFRPAVENIRKEFNSRLIQAVKRATQ